MQLPASAAAFAQATWEDLEPYYRELNDRELDPESVEAWLADWSRLEDLVSEAHARAHFDYTCDVADPAKEAVSLRFAGEIWPRVQEQNVHLGNRLLDLGHSRPGLETMLDRFRNQRAIFREENVAIFGQIEELQSEYEKVTGAMTVVWEGEEVPLPRLLPYLEVQEESVRERAWRLMFGPYVAQRDRLADIFDGLLARRQTVARNAGFASYRDFAHSEKNRFDYSPQDCMRWQSAVEQAVVPAVRRLYERRRKRLGLETLRPWNLAHDTAGRPPLRPFQSAEELSAGTGRMLSRLDSELGAYFQTMVAEGLLDLGSRRGKAPGGYCDSYPASRRPVIFMNAVGVHRDIDTLLHEAGHGFHCFEWFQIEPSFQRFPGSEMCEVASMAMELLGAPYLERGQGGFYDSQEARRARCDHLERVLAILPHIASVDAIQHWIYTEPAAADRQAREAAWLEVRRRFEPVIDWSGLEEQRIARWYHQPHFFLNPFYYIEYGLAQLAALQIWRRSLEDPAGALQGYKAALALGATRPLPELYAAAGSSLVFEAEKMSDLIGFLEEQLLELEQPAV